MLGPKGRFVDFSREVQRPNSWQRYQHAIRHSAPKAQSQRRARRAPYRCEVRAADDSCIPQLSKARCIACSGCSGCRGLREISTPCVVEVLPFVSPHDCCSMPYRARLDTIRTEIVSESPRVEGFSFQIAPGSVIDRDQGIQDLLSSKRLLITKYPAKVRQQPDTEARAAFLGLRYKCYSRYTGDFWPGSACSISYREKRLPNVRITICNPCWDLRPRASQLRPYAMAPSRKAVPEK